MIVVLWSFSFALKRVLHNKRAFMGGIIPSIILVASLISIVMASSYVFDSLVSDYNTNVAMDFFIALSNPPSETHLNQLKQDIRLTTDCSVERYTVIRKTINEMSFALCAIENNSTLWSYVHMQSLTRQLSANECILVLSDSDLPVFSIGEVFSFIEPFQLFNGTRENIEIQTDIVDYASTSLTSGSLTGQLGSSANSLVEAPPNVILFCDYNKTIEQILQYIVAIGTPNEHSLFSGISVNLDRNLLVREIRIGGYQEYIDNIRNSIESILSEYDGYQIFSNIDGAIGLINQLLLQLDYQMIVSSSYLLSMVFLVAVVIRGKSTGLITTDNEILGNRGISEKLLYRLRFFEDLIAAVVSAFCGYILALGSIVVVMNITPTALYRLMVSNSVYSLFLGLVVSFLFFQSISFFNRTRSENHVKRSPKSGRISRFQSLLVILGIYKFTLWIFGISLIEIRLEQQGNLPNVVYSLLGLLELIDEPLDFLAPIFLIYGVSILLSSSRRVISTFERITDRLIGRFRAIENTKIRRDRIHRFILVIVLVTSYVTFTSLIIDSQIDYYDRLKRSEIGSDISAILPSNANITSVTDSIREIPQVVQFTYEHSFSLIINGRGYQTHSVNFSEWLDVAYWEPAWFDTRGSTSPLSTLLENKSNIIVEKRAALELGLDIGDSVQVQLQSSSNTSTISSMAIVGLFGPKPSIRTYSSGFEQYVAEPTYSIVSSEVFDSLGENNTITRILLDIDTSADAGIVVDKLENLSLFVTTLLASEMISYSINQFALNSISAVCAAFALVLSLLGVATLVSDVIVERRKELSALRLRGVSIHVVKLLILSEIIPVLSVISFGILTGLVEVIGENASSYSNLIPKLISSRVVFGFYFICLTFLSISLISIGILLVVFLGKTFSKEKLSSSLSQ